MFTPCWRNTRALVGFTTWTRRPWPRLKGRDSVTNRSPSLLRAQSWWSGLLTNILIIFRFLFGIPWTLTKGQCANQTKSKQPKSCVSEHICCWSGLIDRVLEFAPSSNKSTQWQLNGQVNSRSGH